MKKNISITCVFLFLLAPLSYGQYNLLQLTYASSSASYQGPNMMIDYTIGELAAVSTLRDSSFIITQGLHQPDKYFVGFADYEGFYLKGFAYPNPFSNNISLRLEPEYPEEFDLKIFDALGKIVFANSGLKFSGSHSEQSFNLEYLAEGMYYLRLENKDPLKQTTIPLIKRK